ncbi:hypothetical protein GCM10010977_02800 [Citricoccus zhacaiensis]|uniref:Uncharacterized protein n=1 Tax=Citricoccus zhacaiensis TaxID=489142 RepID=A0ABQ2LMX3_9MICC|nr:hypothetical protein [Citricoccus zhacaiensis]GGO40480.1 hypothetical protein GCM10010977_02800 [Citricoccus zhacaiensis]
MNHRPLPPGVRVADAEEFVYTHGRLLERRRVDLLLHGGGTEGVLAALGAYRNPDGGFGHGLEPDVRSPKSEALSTLTALDLLAGWDLAEHPWVRSGLEWVASTSGLDGSVPFVTEASLEWPHAPWVQPDPGGSHLTYGFAAAALLTGFSGGWAEAASDWCRLRLSRRATSGVLPAYEAKYALRFLAADGLPTDSADSPILAALRERLSADGSLPVEGGAEDESIHAVDLVHQPWTVPFPSDLLGGLVPAAVMSRDRRWLASAQEADGGWSVDWPAWSPAPGLEWRAIRTVGALEMLIR